MNKPDPHGNCMEMVHNIRACVESFNDPSDSVDLYVKQTLAGKNVAELIFVTGIVQFQLLFVDAASLDKLSDFFAHAAQQLRYCSK